MHFVIGPSVVELEAVRKLAVARLYLIVDLLHAHHFFSMLQDNVLIQTQSSLVKPRQAPSGSIVIQPALSAPDPPLRAYSSENVRLFTQRSAAHPGYDARRQPFNDPRQAWRWEEGRSSGFQGRAPRIQRRAWAPWHRSLLSFDR